MNGTISPDYAMLLDDIKSRIRAAQLKAVTSINREMIALYWEIGHMLVQKQEQSGWGDEIVGQLARDLRHDSPGTWRIAQQSLRDAPGLSGLSK